MAQIISAQEGALKKGADAVSSAKSGIDAQVKTVRTEIEQLRGYWSGAAATSFTTLLNKWDEQTTKLNGVLVTLENALTDTEKDQTATEEEHKSTISGLTSMMGS